MLKNPQSCQFQVRHCSTAAFMLPFMLDTRPVEKNVPCMCSWECSGLHSWAVCCVLPGCCFVSICRMENVGKHSAGSCFPHCPSNLQRHFWLGVRCDAEAVATDISLEVMAELSLSVFSAAGCLMVQCVDVSLCVASGQCRSFSEYYFCSKKGGSSGKKLQL